MRQGWPRDYDEVVIRARTVAGHGCGASSAGANERVFAYGSAYALSREGWQGHASGRIPLMAPREGACHDTDAVLRVRLQGRLGRTDAPDHRRLGIALPGRQGRRARLLLRRRHRGSAGDRRSTCAAPGTSAGASRSRHPCRRAPRRPGAPERVARFLAYVDAVPGRLYPLVATLLELSYRGHSVTVKAGIDDVERLRSVGLHAEPLRASVARARELAPGAQRIAAAFAAAGGAPATATALEQLTAAPGVALTGASRTTGARRARR